MKKYLIKEIFGPTIEGEGSNAGKAVLFLRFAACNKWNGKAEDKHKSICHFCDTDFVGGERMSELDILMKLDLLDKQHKVRDVAISGGEPTLQLDKRLVEFLSVDVGFNLFLETNGSNEIEYWRMIKTIAMSPKQPRSETKLKFCHDLKILYPPIHPEITPEAFEDFDCVNRYLQPVDGPDAVLNLQKTIEYITKNPEWRLSVQLHKMIGVD